MSRNPALVGVVMGSESDWDTMKHACDLLQEFGIPFEARVISAHRMPDDMLASKTLIPVLGVPVPSRYLRGEDSLLSIVQMPKGIPVATFAIGEAGAANAALFAVSTLALDDPVVAMKLAQFRATQGERARNMTLPL